MESHIIPGLGQPLDLGLESLGLALERADFHVVIQALL
jgi:hypothetical protein